MDEQELLRLVKQASELEAFEAALGAREEHRRPSAEPPAGKSTLERAPRVDRPERNRRIVFLRVAVAAASAAAVLVLAALFWPRALTVEDLSVTPRAVRGGDDKLELVFRLSRPGHVRVIAIDERRERWALPIAEGDGYVLRVLRVEGSQSLLVPRVPNPEDPRGGVEAVAILLVASHADWPSAQELLEAIPDPVVPPEAGEGTMLKALDRLRGDLEKRFGCAVRSERVPPR
ncbi:MAG: hypothetical protein HY721_24645 [Planctomycetes bacterium]|nr:hypothetical protein [Planctomycetota bacterium]